MSPDKEPTVSSRRWLVAALDREGDAVAAAYVAMAIAHVDQLRPSPAIVP